jgi:tetratricopeptide (TPR) repeat protein
MLSQGAGIRPSRRAAGSLDRLRATIIIAVSGLALSLPECARAQSDKAQPPERSVLGGKASADQDEKDRPSRRSILGPSAPATQERAGWLGKRVVQRYPDLQLTRAGQVLSLHFLNRFVVKEVDKSRLFVQIEGTGDEYWVRADDVVSIEDAISFFTREIQIRPRDYWGYQMRSGCWSSLQEPNRALVDINRAILLCPESSSLHSDRGLVWASMNDYEKAIADFTKALLLSPDSFSILALRGAVYADMERHDDALADLTESLRLNPLYARAYLTRGRAWAGKKDYAKAIADFDKAIEIDQYLLEAYYHRALTLTTTQEYDKAIADYKKILLLYPNYIAPYLGLAQILTRSENASPADVDKAIELLRKACELSDWKDANLIDILSSQCERANRKGDAAKWKAKADQVRGQEKAGAKH